MKKTPSPIHPHPPRWAQRLLAWLHPSETLEEVEGDLDELYTYWHQRAGKTQATLRYLLNVASVLPPFVRRRQRKEEYRQPFFLHPAMLRSYLTIAFRNLTKNKVYSFINIFGLAAGMAVALLIGLWIQDELSYDTYHRQYNRIALVMENVNSNGQQKTHSSNAYVLGEEIRNTYGADFKFVIQATSAGSQIHSIGTNHFTQTGYYSEPQVTEMLSLKMLRGTRNGLTEPYSIFLSESIAKTYFGASDPIGRTIKVDNDYVVKVTGVYEDIPYNSSFRDMKFIMPWKLYLISRPWIKQMEDPWDASVAQTLVQLADQVDMQKAAFKIRDVKLRKVNPNAAKLLKPQLFLHPMEKWHLYAEFKNGTNTGGKIEFVWLFGVIGLFVLLLACINFMNLATARSEKRAKEVGIRKAIGSRRSQLVAQFFGESVLVAILAFLFSLLLVILVLPAFNQIADKKIAVEWASPLFWVSGIGFSLLTGLVAGSYPALYLSSFQPIKVLKGAGPSLGFRIGRFVALPRKVLVVFQFTVSVTLIIGTLTVFRQIQYAKNRPVGYNQNGLIRVNLATANLHNHFEAVRSELKKAGTIVEMAETGSPTTEDRGTYGGFDWEGKSPTLTVAFPNNAVTPDYGKTIGWQLKEGRDFSRAFTTDSAAFIINESAVKFMDLKDPIGATIRWSGKAFTVIGVVKDMVVRSPYEPSRASVFHLSNSPQRIILLKLHPGIGVQTALETVETIFKKYDPGVPFQYHFVDEQYAQKFGDEERIGKLTTFFTALAIVISCLGIFGLASFVAEQRTKEIGIRKVLGASVMNLWKLLSTDFIGLVFIACFIAIPIASIYLNDWLRKYTYHTELSWWIVAVSSSGFLVITLLTVSFQSVKAALMNPVKSLRSE